MPEPNANNPTNMPPELEAWEKLLDYLDIRYNVPLLRTMTQRQFNTRKRDDVEKLKSFVLAALAPPPHPLHGTIIVCGECGMKDGKHDVLCSASS